MNSDDSQAVPRAESAPQWDRQPGESSRAFAAFVAYRDLGPSRSIDSAWRAAQTKQAAKKRQKGGRSAARRADGRFSAWCKKWRWVERAELWDADIDRQRQQAEADARRRMAETQAKQAARLSAALADPILTELERRARENPAMLRRMGAEKLLKLATGTARVLPALQLSERLARLGGDGKIDKAAEASDPPSSGDFEWPSEFDDTGRAPPKPDK